MKWMYKLERKFGHLAIRNLMTYIVGINLLVYILMLADTSGLIISKLILDPYLVLKGEIWRLITFVFIPPQSSMLFILFVLYFYYVVGNALENEWGSFKFNIYYLIGMLGTAAAAMVTGSGTTPVYLNLSLFLAFAQLFPDYELLLFFVLPMKIKYLAWLDWALIAYSVIFQPIPLKVAAVVSVINYFVFFGRDTINDIKFRRQVYNNRKRFLKEVHRRR